MQFYFTSICIVLLFASQIYAQQRIDNTIPFQSDPAKQYSIYVPSSYDPNVPNMLMLGLHPLNTNRWNSVSWCDTLIAFAEMNNLLLICPDGGADGAIDDPIDTAFTSLILDSMMIWYNVNPNKVFAMGFSWGGRTTYTYGLNHVEKFAGFIPIGAAVNGTNEVNGIINNAADKPYYIVHGGSDAPNTRFTPIKNALENAGACVNSLLMPGIGHTIDFPNRNAILTTAFEWVDSVSCGVSNIKSIKAQSDITVFPNPVQTGKSFQIEGINTENIQSVTITDDLGRIVWMSDTYTNSEYPTKDLLPGQYFVQVQGRHVVEQAVLVVVAY